MGMFERLRPVLFISMPLLFACAFSPPYVPEPQDLQPGRLPVANMAISVPNLGPCTDSPDRTLHLNSSYPVTVLVHGCNGSAGRFRSLAQLYAFHGQQAVCYSYDDRDSLVNAADQLMDSLNSLATHMASKNISVIGHSMGGLVARKAMEKNGKNDWRHKEVDLKLTTVSAPLAGIEIASTCGSNTLKWLTLGIVPGLCWIVSGDNWFEITASSGFIRNPGPLKTSVKKYLKVVTNEKNTCRRKNDKGKCLESDFIFELAEQYHPVIDKYPQVTNIQVNAGHVEIVGYKNVAPRKLLAILQEEGMLAPTPPERQAALEQLLRSLY